MPVNPPKTKKNKTDKTDERKQEKTQEEQHQHCTKDGKNSDEVKSHARSLLRIINSKQIYT
jgi:hypothetical protein